MFNSKALLGALALACAYTVHASDINSNSGGCDAANTCGVISPYGTSKNEWAHSRAEWYKTSDGYWHSSTKPGCFIDPKGYVDNHCGAAYLILQLPASKPTGQGRHYFAKIDQLKGCCIPDYFYRGIQKVWDFPW